MDFGGLDDHPILDIDDAELDELMRPVGYHSATVSVNDKTMDDSVNPIKSHEDESGLTSTTRSNNTAAQALFVSIKQHNNHDLLANCHLNRDVDNPQCLFLPSGFALVQQGDGSLNSTNFPRSDDNNATTDPYQPTLDQNIGTFLSIYDKLICQNHQGQLTSNYHDQAHFSGNYEHAVKSFLKFHNHQQVGISIDSNSQIVCDSQDLKFSLQYRHFLSQIIEYYHDKYLNGCVLCCFDSRLHARGTTDIKEEEDFRCIIAKSFNYNEFINFKHSSSHGGSNSQVLIPFNDNPNNGKYCTTLYQNDGIIRGEYVNDISFLTAALNTNNLEAFDLILFKIQEIYRYVDISILHGLIECGAYNLYLQITNNNQKVVEYYNFLSGKETTFIISDNNDSNYDNNNNNDKYKHITFINPLYIQNNTNIDLNNVPFDKNNLSLLPTDPATGQTIISFLFNHHDPLTLNRHESTSEYWQIYQFWAHVVLLEILPTICAKMIDDKPPLITNTTEKVSKVTTNAGTSIVYNDDYDKYTDATCFLQNNYPHLIPFQNICGKRSIMNIITHLLTYRLSSHTDHPHYPTFNLTNDEQQRFFYDKYFTSRYAGPILTRYLWLIEILNLHWGTFYQYFIQEEKQQQYCDDSPNNNNNINDIVSSSNTIVSQMRSTLKVLLKDITLDEFYAILIHQDITCVGKWFYLMNIYRTGWLIQFKTSECEYISEYTHESDSDLLLTLILNLIMFYTYHLPAVNTYTEKSPYFPNKFITRFTHINQPEDIDQDHPLFQYHASIDSELEMEYIEPLLVSLFFPTLKRDDVGHNEDQYDQSHQKMQKKDQHQQVNPPIISQTIQNYVLDNFIMTIHEPNFYMTYPRYIIPDQYSASCQKFIFFLVDRFIFDSTLPFVKSPLPYHELNLDHLFAEDNIINTENTNLIKKLIQIHIKSDVINRIMYFRNDEYSPSWNVVLSSLQYDNPFDEFVDYSYLMTSNASAVFSAVFSTQQGYTSMISDRPDKDDDDDEIQFQFNKEQTKKLAQYLDTILKDIVFTSHLAADKWNSFLNNTTLSDTEISFKDAFKEIYFYNKQHNIDNDPNDYYSQQLKLFRLTDPGDIDDLNINNLEIYLKSTSSIMGYVNLPHMGLIPLNPFAVFHIASAYSRRMSSIWKSIYHHIYHIPSSLTNCHRPGDEVKSQMIENDRNIFHQFDTNQPLDFIAMSQQQYQSFLGLISQCTTRPLRRRLCQRILSQTSPMFVDFLSKTLFSVKLLSVPFSRQPSQFVESFLSSIENGLILNHIPIFNIITFIMLYFSQHVYEPKYPEKESMCDSFSQRILTKLPSHLQSSIYQQEKVTTHYIKEYNTPDYNIDTIYENNNDNIINFTTTTISSKEIDAVSRTESIPLRYFLTELSLSLYPSHDSTGVNEDSFDDKKLSPIQPTYKHDVVLINGQQAPENIHQRDNNYTIPRWDGQKYKITYYPYKILLSLIAQKRDDGGIELIDIHQDIISQPHNQNPLSLHDETNTKINPYFLKIDSIEKLYQLHFTLDPRLKLYIDNIEHLFRDDYDDDFGDGVDDVESDDDDDDDDARRFGYDSDYCYYDSSYDNDFYDDGDISDDSDYYYDDSSDDYN